MKGQQNNLDNLLAMVRANKLLDTGQLWGASIGTSPTTALYASASGLRA